MKIQMKFQLELKVKGGLNPEGIFLPCSYHYSLENVQNDILKSRLNPKESESLQFY